MTDAEGHRDSGVVLKCARLAFFLHLACRMASGHEKGAPMPRHLRNRTAPQKGVVRLTITHDEFEVGSKTYEGVKNGWPAILSSLKSLLETGEPLDSNKSSSRISGQTDRLTTCRTLIISFAS